MKVFIDGDGSPVKETTIELVDQQLEIIIVTSIDHYSLTEYTDNVTFVYVDKGSDSADYKIVQLIEKNDLLITQDYGLASLVLFKGARVLHQLGYEYTIETMDQLLESRYVHAKIRKSGGKMKGPKPYTEEDREKFKLKLNEVLSQMDKR